MRRMLCGWVLVLLLIALAGCGNMGPLYFPDDPHPPVYVPPPKAKANAPASPASAAKAASSMAPAAVSTAAGD